MQRFRKRLATAISLALVAVTLPASSAAASRHGGDPEDAALAFDPAGYTTITVTVDGQPTTVRWYREICDVARPVAAAAQQPGLGGGTTTITNTRCGYQSINVFVPQATVGDQRAPIYFAVNNSGWAASYIRASVTAGAAYASATSNVGAALKAGYVFVDVAGRSRNLVGADGSWPGKSPAAIVDAKAAVRYLRLNDHVMPGSAERIVVNGTSGGGALASILGAAGNSPEYYRYLAQIGAAGITADGRSTIRDDVFAVNAYCPITDLGNADRSYEWLFNVLNTRTDLGQNPAPADAAAIAAQFPAYEKSLGLGLSASTMLNTIKREVIRSAETYLRADPANTIPALGESFVIQAGGPPGTPPATKSYLNDWIDADNATNRVRSVDMKNYLDFVATQATLKTTPAFDPLGVNGNVTSGAETNLFGPADQRYLNYTEYSWDHNNVAGDGSGLDDTGLTWAQYIRKPGTQVDDQVHLINPMDFIGTKADTAPYWYVRTGTRDRDTSFIVSINLDRALDADKQVKDVNYRLAWNQPHAGNYDVPEAMAWIAAVARQARR
ncbi:subtype B tannase [Paractinoplanes toevensis]|uniref:Alpha/beta hydrolase n=1 Tax=Paractinoplanes toevensis TaxID=571911 RepID=A0A919W3I2_9ACTN|nr:subtype B tannase [Actinoplanes toevensis]GIM90560.1 alpha/beta hydrolase [Actinoplanes toevensis]